MRSASRAALALLLVLAGAFAPPAAAQPGKGRAATSLTDSQGVVNGREHAGAWLDPSGAATLDEVLRSPARFQPVDGDTLHPTRDGNQLWMHLRLVRPRAEAGEWLLALPMPGLDAVTVFQQDAAGRWVGRSAGDTLAVADWPQPGRYPYFHLYLPSGQARDVYLRIRHHTPANFPLELRPEAVHEQALQVEYLGLGAAFGSLLLLIAACIASSIVFRDRIYAWYAAYALVTTVAAAAYTGAAAHLLWPFAGGLADAMKGMLALFALGAALLFVRNLIGIPGRLRRVDQLVLGAGIGGFVLGLLYPLLHKGPAQVMMAAYVGGAALANIWIAFAGWRRGDAVGGWVLLATAPLSIAIGVALLRVLGFLPVGFTTQYALVVAMAVEVPLLLVALSIRSRERHGAEIRELALSTQDALTGLLAAHLFHDRLRQVVARYRRDQDNAAIVFIDLVNYPQIKSQFGSAVAEQSLLRSVIKLRRLLRDVDTVSRVGDARFGLILEGVTSRVAVTDRAARLIAAGLMPLKGLKPDVTLQFHTAAVLLEERMGEPEALVRALDELLASMSPRTRRPIRFLDPVDTQPAGVEPDSMIDSVSGPAPALPATASVVPISRNAKPT